MHTQAGYIRYWRYDLLGNVHDTGRIYTPFGTDQTDFRLLTRVTDIRIQLSPIRLIRSGGGFDKCYQVVIHCRNV